MPLYVYRCHNGHETEELRKMGDREKLGCCHECGWSTEPIPTTPKVRFGIPGVKGHYKSSTLELPNG